MSRYCLPALAAGVRGRACGTRGKAPAGRQSTEARHAGGPARSSAETPVIGVERRGRAMPLLNVLNYSGQQRDGLRRDAAGWRSFPSFGRVCVSEFEPFDKSIGFAVTARSDIEFAQVGGQCCQEVAEAARSVRGLPDNAAADGFENLDERDPVRVEPVASGDLHDQPRQAVVNHQVCPDLLVHRFRSS